MLLFPFSVFSDRLSENNKTKTLTKYGTTCRVPRGRVYIETNPGWLELPLTGTNFHGAKPIEPLKFYCRYVKSKFSGSRK